MSRWLRIADLTPEPVPEPHDAAPVVPVHLPRAEDPFTRRARRTAGAFSAAVHLMLILAVVLLPGLVAPVRRAVRAAAELPQVPVTFHEYRPAPPRRSEPRAEAKRGDRASPSQPQPPKAPDAREAGASGARAPVGPDQGAHPLPGGSILPPETGPPARSAPASRPGTGRFDLNRALEDFRRRVPPPDPREGPGPGAGSSGAGAGRGMPSFSSGGFGVGNLEFESRDYDWTDYYRQIYLAILHAWYSRLYQTTDRFEKFALDRGDWLLDDAARIRFTILRSGQVVDVSVEGASACLPLDDSAVDALREVVLPPLPPDFPRGQETVHGRFIAVGDIRQMRRYLESARARGIF